MAKFFSGFFFVILSILAARATNADDKPPQSAFLLKETWWIGDKPTMIHQVQGDKLLFVNEFGQADVAEIEGQTVQVWGMTATITVKGPTTTINFPNNTSWSKSDVQGGFLYFRDGKARSVEVTRMGPNEYVFLNEDKAKSKGRFVSSNRMVADEWGLEVTVLSTDTHVLLVFSNGTAWERPIVSR